MRVDVHAHCWPGRYLDVLAEHGPETGHVRMLEAGDDQASVSRRLAAMDRAGIDRQIMTVLAQVPYLSQPQAAARAARLGNDLLTAVVRRHPDRFAAFGTVPLPHLPETLREASRAVDELGMPGIAVTGTVRGVPLADPMFAPLFAALDERAAVLFVHPSGAGCVPGMDRLGLGWAAGAPVEDTLTAIQLVQAGLPHRYPRARIVLCHLGGPLPMLAGRIDHAMQTPGAWDRLWYDTAGHRNPAALRCAVDTLGAGRILLGTDYPFTDGQPHIESAGLRPADTAAILSSNAARLLSAPDSGEAGREHRRQQEPARIHRADPSTDPP